MSANERKKRLILNLPYVIAALICTNLGEAWRLAEGTNASEKMLSLMTTLHTAFANPLPSFHPLDLCIGIICGLLFRLAVYMERSFMSRILSRPSIRSTSKSR